MPNEKEECRRGVLAVEHYIDRQLESLHIPIPRRVCAVKSDLPQAGSMEILYSCRDGSEVTISFSAEELQCFRRRPMRETLSKVQHLAVEIHKAETGGRLHPGNRPIE